MPLLQVLVLAVVQGFTEFLPVSSTAHLYLTSWFLNWRAETLEFDIMLHLGTLLAVLIYFGRDWYEIILHGFGVRGGHNPELKHNQGLLWLIAIGTVPVVIAGLLLKDKAETTWRSPFVMGAMLVLVGVLMWVAEHRARRVRGIVSVNLLDALSIGLAQCLAIVPGVSRSGITITAGLFRDFEAEGAARFSFLLSTPAIGGAAAKALWDVHKAHMLHTLATPQFAAGVLVSALTGCAVIAWFLRYLRNSGLRPFVYYRVVFGIIVLALAFIRRPA
jgi:undecaprenyl-diphosphatase